MKSRPAAAPASFLDDSEQARQLRTCLNDTGMPLDLRVAGALVLIYGLTLSRIAYLTRDDITTPTARAGCAITGTSSSCRPASPPSSASSPASPPRHHLDPPRRTAPMAVPR